VRGDNEPAPVSDHLAEADSVLGMRSPLLRAPGVSLMFRRGWLLLLLDAGERAGMTPFGMQDIHLLAFVADALAPVYDIPAVEGTLLRRNTGPYYPTLAWDIERLWALGLLHRASHGSAPMYTVTPRGSEVTTDMLTSPGFQAHRAFLHPLFLLISRMPRATWTKLAAADLTYSTADVDELLTYGDWASGNASVATAEAFSQVEPRRPTIAPWEKLGLYLTLLNRRLLEVKVA